MKKLLIIGFLLLAALLAGCNKGPSYHVSMTKPLYFLKDKATPLEIKVTENKKPVKGLAITAEANMAHMDHGTRKAKLSESNNGKYSGKIMLPMDGKYEITFTMKKDGKISETTLNYTVKKAQGVATINGKWITAEELKFYQLVNRIQLEVNRAAAKKQYHGAALKDELAYIDSQVKNSSDPEQLLTQIIRTRAMAMLAEQRGHKATPSAVQAAINKDHKQYSRIPAVKELIAQFGTEKYGKMERQEYQYIVLSQQVEADVRKQAIKDNPKAGSQEIDYQTQQNYEDLLVSQMNSLRIEIF